MPQPRRRPPQRRGRGEAARERSRGGSDLGARIVVAVPALAFALALVVAGGWVFVAGVAILGVFCLQELFAMFTRARPARFAGIIGLLGLLVAAHLGDRETVLLVFLACLPLTFLVVVNQ